MTKTATTNPVPTPARAGETWVALTGNPNCGKTTVFNALTGLRGKVGNYAGVTVERKEGRMLGGLGPGATMILDLPGTYSLSPQSLDEEISRDVLLQRLPEAPAPTVVVVVVDASNLERNLYYATQVIELGYPTVVALNMMDVARENGQQVSPELLAKRLNVAVVPMVASEQTGLTELRAAILLTARERGANRTPPCFAQLPETFTRETEKLAPLLRQGSVVPEPMCSPLARLVLCDERALGGSRGGTAVTIRPAVDEARQRLEAAGIDWRSVVIESRYRFASATHQAVTDASGMIGETVSDRLDRVLTHKTWGMLIFVAIMAAMFQSIFTFAQYPMEWIEGGVAWVGGQVGRLLPPGDLHSLLVDGVIAGVGAVVVFLPQICLLFLFIGLLEDTGYMARAAFLMDQLMSRVGLHGKSFIPMLSSFACAIPGIMATRTIENPKDRLVTILVAPLMSCSARLPVYTVLIAACIPDWRWFGVVKLQGLVMLAMYLLGIVVALLMAWLFKKTLLKGNPPLLIMELPPYKRPVVPVVLRHMWDRSKLFLRRAGTVILAISILLWFLATYPRDSSIEAEFASRRAATAESGPESAADPRRIEEVKAAKLAKLDTEEAGEKLRRSFAGRLGQLIEPAIAPLGFDWKIGIGIVASFAAREVFVSTMSTVYNVGESEDSTVATKGLAETLRAQTRPDGTPVYTPLVAITLMVFYVFALQCVSTVAVVRRETNGWKWPIFQWVYMGLLAWVLAFVTYQGGRWLGWG